MPRLCSRVFCLICLALLTSCVQLPEFWVYNNSDKDILYLYQNNDDAVFIPISESVKVEFPVSNNQNFSFEAGGCRYLYSSSEEWLTSASIVKNSSISFPYGKWRVYVDADFELNIYFPTDYIKVNNIEDSPIVGGGFPAIPEVTCGAAS